ncbi:hypothetical protein BDA99DRAFT_527552 [Phascolomyces articulosus]|uniref:GDP/GTP exchange factor Sec2 N-terminal domain-containing protein n=1 Tax=Phascolomyces articulosus TaxID=60185 RepID=A0AAD5JYM6_9FUNG|nr:hypothetical protein BDA99DRAFT_527552 [Phascolomyces articulosus]
MQVSSEGIFPLSEHQHQPLTTEEDDLLVSTLDDLQFGTMEGTSGGMDDFSEDDVLPFLLQAQDIIAKLEGRVLDLETDLSTIHRKYEHDRHDWLVGLSQKDQYIHHLSKKLQKLEFNSKEAIVLISDYEQGEQPGYENNLSLALNFLRQAQQTTATPAVVTEDDFPETDDLEEGELERRAAATNEWRKQEEYAASSSGVVVGSRSGAVGPADAVVAAGAATHTASTGTTTSTPIVPISFRVSPWTHHSEQPVNLMEGLESSVDGSEISRHTDVDSLQAESTGGRSSTSGGTFSTNTSVSSMTRMPSTDGGRSSTDLLHHSQQQQQQQQQQPTGTTPSTALGTPPSANDPTSTPLVEPTTTTTTTRPISSVPLPTTDHGAFCSNCRQLLAQLDQQIEQKAYMKRDLSSLASALSEEEQLRYSIEQVKDSLEEDIQEVTTDLFKTLNAILMDEVNDREGLVHLDRETGGKLTRVLQAWDTREERLRDIKEQLVELDAAVNQSATATERLGRYRQDDFDTVLPRSRNTMMRHSSLRLASPTSPLVPLSEDESILSLGGPISKTVRIDGVVFDEFQHHIKALTTTTTTNAMSTSSSATATALHAMPTTPFMKRVIAEDVDPCLFQTGGSSWWKSPWFKRKLTDAIVSNRCEIQNWNSSNNNTAFSSSASSSPATSHISTTSSASAAAIQQQQASAPKTKCTCCGMLRICEFRMRLQHPNQNVGSLYQQQQQQKKPAPWLPIDRFCRDRIVAVCDFYSFMSHLRQGLMQNSPVLHMFKQCQHYRRRMGLAKVGSMSLFDNDPLQGISSSKRSPSTSNHKRRSRSSKRESLVLEHSGNNSDSGSVVSVTDVQGIVGPGQIVIVH